MGQPSWIGYNIGGRYKIERLLGQGGMSAVYQANDPNLRRSVAIKLIHAHLSTDPEFVKRFEEEAAAVAQLRHPHIIQVYDFNQDNGTFYMVLEFVQGETLQARLKGLSAAGKKMPLAEAIRLMVKICDAAGYAHGRGMVHRDLKPANVMLNPQGEPILMDFGVAKIKGGQMHTATGAIVGTPLYMSPEQARGDKLDARTDLYALGVMLYEMAAGKPPFEADSAMSIMLKHLNEPVPDISPLVGNESPIELKAIIEKALSKDPAQRFQSAAEMGQALQVVGAQLAGATLVTDTPSGLKAVEVTGTMLPTATATAATTAGKPFGEAAVPVPTETVLPTPAATTTSQPSGEAAGPVVTATMSPAVTETPTPTTTTTSQPSSAVALPVATTNTPPAPIPTATIASQPSGQIAIPREATKDKEPERATRPALPWMWIGLVGLFILIGGVALTFTVILPALQGPQATDTQAPTLPAATNTVGAVIENTATDQPTNRPTDRPTATQAIEITPTSPPPTAVATEAPTPIPVPENMALIPSGTFTMGSTNRSDEAPEHQVTLSNYFIDRFEVSNARYAVCVEAGACTIPARRGSFTRSSYFDNPDFANYPVVFVTWEQADAFCTFEGKRLPTEAEWEFAAGGPDELQWPWGSAFDATLSAASAGDTQPIDAYPDGVSPFGIFNMAGNVGEWVADRYARYTAEAQTDPIGPEAGNARVFRGGSFGNTDRTFYTTTRRFNQGQRFFIEDIGFRCAADVP